MAGHAPTILFGRLGRHRRKRRPVPETPPQWLPVCIDVMYVLRYEYGLPRSTVCHFTSTYRRDIIDLASLYGRSATEIAEHIFSREHYAGRT